MKILPFSPTAVWWPKHQLFSSYKLITTESRGLGERKIGYARLPLKQDPGSTTGKASAACRKLCELAIGDLALDVDERRGDSSFVLWKKRKKHLQHPKSNLIIIQICVARNMLLGHHRRSAGCHWQMPLPSIVFLRSRWILSEEDEDVYRWNLFSLVSH